MRPIAAIKAMEEAVGRATEMGTPVLYVPGISSLDQIDTISGLTILGHVAGMTAEYEANLHVPVCVPIVIAINEFVKRKEIKVETRHQRRQKLDFGTKLGMNSPF